MEDIIMGSNVDGLVTSLLGRGCLFFASIAIIAFVFEYGNVAFGLSFLEKGHPDWSRYGIVKMLTSAVAAFLIFASIQIKPASPHSSQPQDDDVGRLPVLVLLAIYAITTSIVIVAPHILNDYVREGQLVGVLTDICLGIALLIFLSRLRVRQEIGTFRGTSIGARLPIAIIATTCFLLLMEEMSWGQHLFGWTAGELFANNLQNETNLHNFYTYKFEAAYYTAALLAFGVLPALWRRTNVALIDMFDPFIPGRTLAIAGLLVAGLMYEEWNIQLYQTTYFLSILMLVWLAIYGTSTTRYVAAGAALTLLVSQMVFLSNGSRMVDGYELSEIREFLISLLMLSYAVHIARRFRPAQSDAKMTYGHVKA
jgi:hypothetical protein